MTRHARKFEHWPEADRAMWASLTAGGHILDEAGAGSHWRPKTRLILMRDYGYWLAFLCEAGVDLQAEHPLARLKALKMQSFILTLADLAPSSRACIIRSLSVIAVKAYPTSDWQWLQALRRPLDAAERAQQGLRKAQKIVSSRLLFDVGLKIMRVATSDFSRSAFVRAVDFRDGLAIALLASRPLRISNLAFLRLDHQLKRSHQGWLIEIPGAETKTGQAIEMEFPQGLVPALLDYLNIYRSLLVAGRPSDRLWIGRWGHPIGSNALGLRISATLHRAIGIRVTPHLFRDAAATTIATADPEHVRMITPLLGHASPVTAEKYYNHASSLEASRAHQTNIRELRESTRAIGRRGSKGSRR